MLEGCLRDAWRGCPFRISLILHFFFFLIFFFLLLPPSLSLFDGWFLIYRYYFFPYSSSLLLLLHPSLPPSLGFSAAAASLSSFILPVHFVEYIQTRIEAMETNHLWLVLHRLVMNNTRWPAGSIPLASHFHSPPPPQFS